MSDGGDKFVAHRVAMRVIDEFEAIQIQENERVLGAGSFCRSVGLIKQDSQLVAVGEASQGIGGSEALEAHLVPLFGP
mgnify:CR=1 FL=1